LEDSSRWVLERSAIDPRIPSKLHPAIEVARRTWQELFPGMELDATADVIVLALATAGLLRTSPRRSRVRERGSDAAGG
jgi:hypothetical protein